jgi:hypothetical protein
MASTEQILAAIEKAQAAGDDAAVADLRDRLGITKTESALRGAAQSATLGFGDEIEGLIQAALPVPGDTGSFFDRYRKWRDVSRTTDARASAANPKSSLAGGLAGAAVTAPALAALAPAPLAGAGLVARTAQGIKTAAPIGAVYGAGSSDATTIGGLATDSALGAAGAGLVGGGVSAVAPPVAAWLKARALEYGRKALSGVGNSLSARKEISPRAVEAAYDVGAIRPLSNVTGISERLETATDALAPQYGAVLRELEAAGIVGPDAERIARELLFDATQKRAASLGSKVPAMMEADAMELAEKVAGQPDPRLSLSAAEGIKRDLQDQARAEYAKIPSKVSQEGDYKKQIAALMRREIEQEIDAQSALHPEAAAKFAPIRDRLAALYEAGGAAEEGAARAARRGPLGMGGMLAATGVLSGGGGPLAAGGTAALTQSMLSRLSSTLGSTARAGSKVLESSAGRGPPVVQSTPAVQEQIRKLMEFLARSRTAVAGAEDEQP